MKYSRILGLTLLISVVSGTALAQQNAVEPGVAEVMNKATVNPTLSDRVQFRVGPFFANWDSTVDIQGTEFDLDEQLGDSDTVLGVGGFVRLTRRIRINFGYWASSRENTTLLNDFTQVGPITLPPGTQFESDYETSTVRGSLGWAFVTNDRVEFGADAGLSWVTIKNNLTGRLPNVAPIDIVSVDEAEPMGTIGLFFQYAFTPQLSFAARAGALGFDIGNIEGEIYAFEGRLDYRPFRNIGFGVAYQYDNADVTLKDDPTSREITYTNKGAFLYVNFAFGSIR